jgi:hypothetical protein
MRSACSACKHQHDARITMDSLAQAQSSLNADLLKRTTTSNIMHLNGGNQIVVKEQLTMKNIVNVEVTRAWSKFVRNCPGVLYRLSTGWDDGGPL